MEKFTSPAEVNKLNSFELCLLILAIRNDKVKLSLNILDYMKMQNGIFPKNRKIYEAQFDSAMGVT